MVLLVKLVRRTKLSFRALRITFSTEENMHVVRKQCFHRDDVAANVLYSLKRSYVSFLRTRFEITLFHIEPLGARMERHVKRRF
jgi:hypothetical protein